MHPNEELLTRFYTAFANRDAGTMAVCYADDASFEDPAFGRLDADQVKAMWRMLLGRSKDLRANFRDVHADDDAGNVHWEASYTFQGRQVHNVIDGYFQFYNGLIVTHLDNFDWPRWAAQALGLTGKLLGRTEFLHSRVQARARDQLAAFMAVSPDVS